MIVVLTTIPCIDELHDNTLVKSEIYQQTAHSHADGADHCSPFCTCQCCATPVIYTANNYQISVHNFITNSYSTYEPFFFNAPLSSIWQPPQI